MYINNLKKDLKAPKYDICTAGRSMIEMLGVLAIIAVLSVGGLAGYSKAMQMWKSNIQKNALTELMMTMIKIKPNLSRDMTDAVITDVLVGLGEIPESMTVRNNMFYDKNNNSFYLFWGAKSDEGGMLRYRLYVSLNGQGGSKFITPEAKETCRNLILAAQSVASEINYMYYWRKGSQSSYSKSFMNGNDLSAATISDIYKRCDIIMDDDALNVSHFVIDFKVN